MSSTRYHLASDTVDTVLFLPNERKSRKPSEVSVPNLSPQIPTTRGSECSVTTLSSQFLLPFISTSRPHSSPMISPKVSGAGGVSFLNPLSSERVSQGWNEGPTIVFKGGRRLGNSKIRCNRRSGGVQCTSTLSTCGRSLKPITVDLVHTRADCVGDLINGCQ